MNDWFCTLAGTDSFIGLGNYVYMFTQDDLFRTGVYNTAIYTFVKVSLTLFLGLVIALGLYGIKKVGLRSWLLTGYYAPNITSMVASALVFKYLYDPNFGLINQVLKVVGLRFSGLHSPSTALLSIALMDTWKGLGFAVVIFLNGLLAVPKEYYEAARMDGASSLQSFFYITLPQLAPTTAFVLLNGTIASLRALIPIYAMSGAIDGTPGGPFYSTYTLALHIFNSGFQYFRMDYASAISTIMFLVVLVLIWWGLRFETK